jgi:hypothetical protein
VHVVRRSHGFTCPPFKSSCPQLMMDWKLGPGQCSRECHRGTVSATTMRVPFNQALSSPSRRVKEQIWTEPHHGISYNDLLFGSSMGTFLSLLTSLSGISVAPTFPAISTNGVSGASLLF